VTNMSEISQKIDSVCWTVSICWTISC